MGKRVILSCLTILGTFFSFSQVAGVDVFINEIHYDNFGTDANEGLEIAGPAGTDLSTFTLTLYNGSGGVVYGSVTLSGIIPNQSNGYGTLCFFGLPSNSIQNGAPDGMSLSNATSVYFISYEGTFVAVGGPANGIMSTDIGVSQNSDPVGTTLQLTGSGTVYSDFTWAGQVAQTPCAINTGQSFGTSCNTTATISPVACETYTVPSGDETYTVSGTYLDTIPNAAACDSVITIDLTIHPSYDVTDAVTICDGSTYVFGTQSLTVAGVYTEVFQSVNSCDSTVELNLSTVTSFTTNISESICTGETYVLGAQNLTTQGLYTETFTSSLGCDSTVNLNLTVLPVFTSNTSEIGCGSYTSPSGNYTWTLSGIYNDTIPSIQNGCDSVLVIDLTIADTNLIEYWAMACDQFLFEGNTYTQGGIYDVVYSNQFGCDSTLRLHLQITQTPSTPITSGDQELCDGDTPTDITIAPVSSMALIISGVLDGPLPGGLPKLVEFYAIENISDLSVYGFGSANNGGGTDGEEFTFPNISINAGEFYRVGTDSVEFNNFFGFYPNASDANAGNINGDDAIELFMNGSVIDVFGQIDVDGTGTAWDYLDGWAMRNSGSLHNNGVFDVSEWTFSGVDALDGTTSNATAPVPYPLNAFSTSAPLVDYTWYSDLGLSVIEATGNTYSPAIAAFGSETVYVTAAIGSCESAASAVTVTINALPSVEAGAPQTVCAGENVVLSGAGAQTYDWDNGVSNNVAFSAPSNTTTYSVIGTDANGCENTDQVVITVNPLPTVSYTDITEICSYDSPISLAAGTPSGGTHSGTGVATGIFNPSVAGIGTHIITYSFTDGNGCMNSANWTITVDACAGITDPDLSNSLTIYPNPTNGTITLIGLGESNGTVSISDLSGKIVLTSDFSGDFHTMNLNGLEAGSYLVRTGETQNSVRIVLN